MTDVDGKSKRMPGYSAAFHKHLANQDPSKHASKAVSERTSIDRKEKNSNGPVLSHVESQVSLELKPHLLPLPWEEQHICIVPKVKHTWPKSLLQKPSEGMGLSKCPNFLRKWEREEVNLFGHNGQGKKCVECVRRRKCRSA